MIEYKITVIQKTHHPELVDHYLKEEAKGNFGLCEVFEEGQEFTTKAPFRKPENFCQWAWNDIQQSLAALASGKYSDTVYDNPNVVIACCSDGLRPVIFRIDRIV